MKATLVIAFAWECPVCAQNNFAESVIPELMPEDRAELEEAFGDADDWRVRPEEVECLHCERTFKTTEPGDEDDDDEDDDDSAFSMN